ncbi:MAG: Ribulose-phosphate 3-epimerase [Verrucomicrobia subdivision 3 bacterium]|nr:Ribulose-phosphate 3-epimerase [Limisphaerales bacterium]MCS1412963.1 Ribulose-phosphate 3-epimerase [Limisphaerales bacterium]
MLKSARNLIIAPSLLAANFSRLDREIQRANRSGAEWIHLDIMDGHFVPNLSFGPEMAKTLRPMTFLFMDVHLMCECPEILIDPFHAAGAESITVHAELGFRVKDLLWQIKSRNVKTGLAVNPPTSMEVARPYLKQIDLLLIMTVNPGFGGQKFIPEMLPKIQTAAKWRQEKGLKFRIEVDGGINPNTGSQCTQAGADTLVAGSSLFSKPNLRAAVSHLRKASTH